MVKQEQESARDWFDNLTLSKRDLEKFVERGDKIVKRYRDERDNRSDGEKRYNILWANIRTLLPAVYAKKPDAEVSRRFKDDDQVGRVASLLLERALQYEIDHYQDYDTALKHCVLDRLLPGRGVAWVRYEPHYEAGQPQEAAQITGDAESEVAETLTYECAPVDYVYWKDFRHSPARTWDEVSWVARRVYMSKDEGIARFGEDFKDVPLAHEPIGLQELKDAGCNTDAMKKAVVWEIWDKTKLEALWVAEGCQHILDKKPDPLQLEGFFPCPRPVYATLTSESLSPIADFRLYQDQADELDLITQRIGHLVEAMKVVGVYDASCDGLQRLLNEGVDNTMIPVDSWAMFAEKGGMKGAVDFFPIEMVANALVSLYQAREQTKQVIYEITGLSDIIRGASMASETATAQQIKSQYASLRLKEMQSDVARFASDILRIKAQIMCQFFAPETLVMMSGLDRTPDAQYLPDAIALLQNDNLRSFRIAVASDSLVELDEAQEKADRMEFLQAVSGFLRESLQAPPELTPLLGEMLLFTVRSFKAGKTMEGAIETFTKQAKEKAEQPPPPQPSPEEIKAQAEQAKQQAQLQADQQRQQMEAQVEQQRMAAEMQMRQQEAQFNAQLTQQVEAMKQQAESEREQMRLMFEQWKTQMIESTKINVAQIGAQTALSTAQDAAADASTR